MLQTRPGPKRLSQTVRVRATTLAFSQTGGNIGMTNVPLGAIVRGLAAFVGRGAVQVGERAAAVHRVAEILLFRFHGISVRARRGKAIRIVQARRITDAFQELRMAGFAQGGIGRRFDRKSGSLPLRSRQSSGSVDPPRSGRISHPIAGILRRFGKPGGIESNSVRCDRHHRRRSSNRCRRSPARFRECSPGFGNNNEDRRRCSNRCPTSRRRRKCRPEFARGRWTRRDRRHRRCRMRVRRHRRHRPGYRHHRRVYHRHRRHRHRWDVRPPRKCDGLHRGALRFHPVVRSRRWHFQSNRRGNRPRRCIRP